MTDPAGAPGAAAQTAPEKKKKGGKKGRVMTFLYTDKDGKFGLARTKTNAFSVDEAWKEVVEKEKLEGCTKKMALQGLVHEVEGNQLRKPTYDELMKLSGLNKTA